MAFFMTHQTFTWTSVDFSLVMFCGIHLTAISQQLPQFILLYGAFEDHRSKITVTSNPDSKVHGANMGPIWGRQDQRVNGLITASPVEILRFPEISISFSANCKGLTLLWNDVLPVTEYFVWICSEYDIFVQMTRNAYGLKSDT